MVKSVGENPCPKILARAGVKRFVIMTIWPTVQLRMAMHE